METKPLMQKELPTSVPWYFYEETICGISEVKFLWGANFVAMIFHIGLAFTSVVVSTQGFTKSMATPQVSLYLSNLTWVPNSTDALVPSFVPIEGVFLSHVTLWFFLLSALAHATVVVFNAPQAFAGDNLKSREIGYTGWYYGNLHRCRNPARWIEYSFSASLMGIVFSVTSGATHLYMITSGFLLLWCTMVFGYVAEVVNPPKSNGDDRPEIWHNSKNGTIREKAERLLFHVLGYIPYAGYWFPVLHIFYYSTALSEQKPPDFIYMIIWSQLAIFSVFGLTQLFLLFKDNGPDWFVTGEISYIVLSLTAKGVLGAILMFFVLAYSTFADAVEAAM